ncbi:DNA repair protein RadA [bacterium]|nr:DNA repair protein RadA [bacterium]
MAKIKTKWVCQNCGYETAKYIGKCPDCNAWGTLVEEVETKTTQANANIVVDDTPVCLINDIEITESIRTSSGFEELDRVLGGGLVQGSLLLLAGDPGIGKSTLILQTANNICNQNKKLLYVCAEESGSQVKLRAQRLNVNSNNLYVYSQTNLEAVINQIDAIKPEVLVIDSIQSIYTSNITSSAGSVSQIRECTNALMEIAKNKNITVIVIGHVTKDGNIAGPKVLEHMVDTVIYFECDKYKAQRLLRSIKNRFGSTNEIGVFNMVDNGLVEVTNPSELFMKERTDSATPGSVIIATSEGTRALLVEVQALVGKTSYPSPRRVSTGIEYNRLLQIIAVLEKRIGINLSGHDVYVNVLGGIEIDEPAADLGIALAIATCFRDVVVDPNCVIIGEISLSGEIRNVCNLEKRIYEAQKLGFKKAIVPKLSKKLPDNFEIEVKQVSRLIEAITACVNKK